IKGEFENRLKGLIQEVKNSPTPIILFIDEAHTMIGAGGQAGQNDAANLLKPALARGELRTIAATTWSEYKKYFEKDAALARRFQLVKVEEPSEAQCELMMRGIVPALELHHNVRILDEGVAAAVKLSHRYLPDRQLPDKAVSVLDTTCARLSLGQNATPGPIEDATRIIDDLDVQLRILQREAENPIAVAAAAPAAAPVTATAGQALPAAAGAPVDGDALRAELNTLNTELSTLQGETPLMRVCVDSQLVGEVISGWTGIPVGKMLKDEITTVLSLEQHLGARVIGQAHALEGISHRIRTARAGLDDPVKPVGTFLLVGPSGVGKTETALALSDLLYGGE